jgi:hypothetical protein
MSELIHLSPLQAPEDDDVHVRACVDAESERRDSHDDLAIADVLFFARPTPPALVAAQLDVYPGCLVCAGVAEDGTLVLAVRGGPHSGRAPLVASAVHALLVSRFGARMGCVGGR